VQIEFEALNWDEVMMPVVQPLLDYLAPEYIIGSRCDAYSDMYSLGVLSYAVLNGGRAPFENQNNIKLCKSNIAQVICEFAMSPNQFAIRKILDDSFVN
jgi:serine/threonine protein kinase